MYRVCGVISFTPTAHCFTKTYQLCGKVGQGGQPKQNTFHTVYRCCKSAALPRRINRLPNPLVRDVLACTFPGQFVAFRCDRYVTAVHSRLTVTLQAGLSGCWKVEWQGLCCVDMLICRSCSIRTCCSILVKLWQLRRIVNLGQFYEPVVTMCPSQKLRLRS